MDIVLSQDVVNRHGRCLVVLDRFKVMKAGNENNKKILGDLNESINREQEEGKEKVRYIDLCEKAITVLQQITDDRNVAARKEIEQMINSALSSVFIGEGYTIRIDQRKWGKHMQAGIVLIEKNGKERSLTHGSGDGIKQIISFLCNILIIKFTGCSRLFISDELFDRLSPEYARIISDILVNLADSLDFQFIMVEHNELLWSNPGVNLIRLRKTPKDGLIISNELTQ